MKDILISLNHGLGDVVQASIVLKHIAKYQPDWRVHIEASQGKHSAFFNSAASYVRGSRPSEKTFSKVFVPNWFEAQQCYSGLPSTKVTRSLIEEFGIQPDESLYRYKLDFSSQHIKQSKKYLTSLPQSRGVVLIHYQGTSSPDRKNIGHDDVREICKYLIQNDYLPVILDWDFRSPIPDQRTVFNPDKNHEMWGGTGTGCLATLAALISQARLFIGVDSGPLHAAGATQTPAIGIWTRFHPIHFYDLSHVRHMVPKDHRRNIKQKDRETGLSYFEKKYDYTIYSDLRSSLIENISKMLDIPGLRKEEKTSVLRSRSYNRDYYEEHRAAGLDYAAYGDWQREYGNWATDCMNWRNKNVLDVGCACGAITKGLHDNGCKSVGIDLNEHTICIGRSQWPELPLYVGDSVNLHHFGDSEFDGIHSHQVFEHLNPDLVPFVLRELWRVCKPGGYLFVVLDTQESLNRQNNDGMGDPTHLCIKSMSWWAKMLKMTGWDECCGELSVGLKKHVRSFLTKYDWDWFAARRRASI